MLKTAFKASLLGLAAAIAVVGARADAVPRTSLDDYPVATIGDMESISPALADAYITGMLEMSAIITALQLDDVDAARCIAAQQDQVWGTLNAGLDNGIEMPVTVVVVAVACMDGDLDGDANLIGAEDYHSWLGASADFEERALFLLGARDFLIEHLISDSTEAEMVCVSDAAVSGINPASPFSKGLQPDDGTPLIVPVLEQMLGDCF